MLNELSSHVLVYVPVNLYAMLGSLHLLTRLSTVPILGHRLRFSVSSMGSKYWFVLLHVLHDILGT